MSRGSALENAIARAARHYQRVGRADVVKQHVRVSGGAFTSTAPIDFRGVVSGGGAIALEAKEVSDGISFPLVEDRLPEHERQALDRSVLLGATTLLVIDITREREIYAIDWRDVQRFIAAPWRASLSLQWLRAFGEICKQSDGAAWFLDRRAHAEKETALLAVAAERARAEGKTIELFPAEHTAKTERFAGRPRPGTPEHREYIKQLAMQGSKRALGEAIREAGATAPYRRKQKRGGWYNP